jgi:hypothetical protein
VVAREALVNGKTLVDHHYAHLLVHGTPYAQAGTTKTARTLTRWKPGRDRCHILAELGIANPYQ